MPETQTQSPYNCTSPPNLLCCSCQFQFTSFWINLRHSTKQETDVLEVKTFLPVSDSLFCSWFKQGYLILCCLNITFLWMMQKFQDCSPLLGYSKIKVRRRYEISWLKNRLNCKCKPIQFACACVYFWPNNSTV